MGEEEETKSVPLGRDWELFILRLTFPHAKYLSQGSEAVCGDNSKLCGSETPIKTWVMLWGVGGRNLRLPSLSLLVLNHLLRSQRKRYQGPHSIRGGLGRRRESLHPVWNHLRLSIRHWSRMRSAQVLFLAGGKSSGWDLRGAGSCAFNHISLEHSWTGKRAEGGSSFGSNTTDSSFSYQIFIDFFCIISSLAVRC